MAKEARSTLRIERAESDADLDALLNVRNAVDQLPISRATHAARAAEDVGRLRLVAHQDHVLTGAAEVAWTHYSREIGEAFLRVWVLPDWRLRGIGTALSSEVIGYAMDHGLTKGFCRVLADDAPSLAFARHRGLEVSGRNQVGVLSLDGPADQPPIERADGIRIVSMAERPDLDRAVYSLEARTVTEIPSMADLPVPTFATWRDHLDTPVYLHDLSLVALEGDAVVGAIEVEDDGDRSAFISILSVAPEMRRRGIARDLKRELARRAMVAGWQRLETLNDRTNDAIRRLNEELGYHYLPEVLLLEGSLRRETVAKAPLDRPG